MTYSTVLKSVLLSLCLISSTPLYASPATDASVNKFIQLNEFSNLLNNSLNELQPYFDNQAEQLIRSISNNKELNANELSISLKLSQKMFDLTKQTMTSPKTIDAIKQVIKNTYTEEEVQAYNKFLSTPEGQSINRKSTKVILGVQTAIEEIAIQTMQSSDFENEVIKIIEPLTK